MRLSVILRSLFFIWLNGWDAYEIDNQGQRVDLSSPGNTDCAEAYLKYAGWDPLDNSDPSRFDFDMVDKVMPAFDPERPTVLIEYPAPVLRWQD
jgi:hypothetical protein